MKRRSEKNGIILPCGPGEILHVSQKPSGRHRAVFCRYESSKWVFEKGFFFDLREMSLPSSKKPTATENPNRVKTPKVQKISAGSFVWSHFHLETVPLILVEVGSEAAFQLFLLVLHRSSRTFEVLFASETIFSHSFHRVEILNGPKIVALIQTDSDAHYTVWSLSSSFSSAAAPLLPLSI